MVLKLRRGRLNRPSRQVFHLPQVAIYKALRYNASWQTYQLWANNSGGSFTTTLDLAVHDVDADWQDITAGVGTVNYGSSLPSLILPLGEWSFPVALDWDDRPVISASHAGQGRMVGYGHEGMVGKQGGGNETTLSLNAIEWACGGVNKVVGVS